MKTTRSPAATGASTVPLCGEWGGRREARPSPPSSHPLSPLPYKSSQSVSLTSTSTPGRTRPAATKRSARAGSAAAAAAATTAPAVVAPAAAGTSRMRVLSPPKRDSRPPLREGGGCGASVAAHWAAVGALARGRGGGAPKLDRDRERGRHCGVDEVRESARAGAAPSPPLRRHHPHHHRHRQRLHRARGERVVKPC